MARRPCGGVWAWPGTFGVWGAPEPRLEAEGNRAWWRGARGRNALADSPSAMRADLTAATVEDVCEWVGSLGLDEYVATFQHHGIDGSQLIQFRIIARSDYAAISNDNRRVVDDGFL